MKAGDDYISFIKEFLQLTKETDKIFNFHKYKFESFEELEDLIEQTKKINEEYGKTRLLASLSLGE